MSPERWEQISRLFHAALAHNAQQRHNFIAEACEGDEELTKEIESLLSAHEQRGNFIDFIEEPAADIAAELLAFGQAGLIAGQFLGPYRVVRLIGAGGMGEVYLAEDTRLDRKVALKLLPRQFTVHAEWVRRFEQEARAASSLNHPNIVTIHDIGRWQDRDFIATEFIEGTTLRELMDQRSISVEETLDIAVQLASALSAAHEAGIVHRDIKPENIMIRRDRIVKVLDFGLAKLTDQQSPSITIDASNVSVKTTSPGIVMGTAQYMSPEQARGESVDARTDIWSLGVVLYEMSTGRAPFEGVTAGDVTVSILEKNPPPVSQYADAPPTFDQVVRKAIAKDRNARYETMRELLNDLRQTRDDLVFKSRGHAGAHIKRKKWAVIATLATTIVAVGAAAVLYKSSARQPVAFTNHAVTKVSVPRQVYAGLISPDGKRIAYVSITADGEQGLWVTPTDADKSVMVVPPAKVGIWGFDFSPDGESLYYVIQPKDHPTHSVLYRVSASGGTPQKLQSEISGVFVSPDGSRLALKSHMGDNNRTRLITVNTEGGDERLITDAPGGSFWSVDWSPDSKSLVYVNPTTDGITTKWYIGEVPATGGPERRITQPSTQRLRAALCLADCEELLVLANEESTLISQMFVLSRQSGEMRRLTRDLTQYDQASVTTDGRHILATARSRPASLWVRELNDAKAEREILPGPIDVDHVVWTPDGHVIADEGSTLWEMNSDGGEGRLLKSDSAIAYPVISADGQYVVIVQRAGEGLNIWRINRDGSNETRLTTNGGLYPAISPDGQWVFYTNPNYGYTGVWRVPLAGGTPELVVPSIAYKVAVSPDGQFLAVAEEEQPTKLDQIVVMPISGGKPIKVFKDTSIGYGNLRWAPDGRSLIFVNSKSGDLELLPLSGGSPQKLVERGAEEIFSFDISADGKRVVYAKGTLISTLVLISDTR
jgi:eukaryotic-like serine/threonine-protein kinase